MINHILVYLIAFIAAFADAMKDTLKDHFSSSIWWNKNQIKWNPVFSWKGKKFLGMVWDPWHIDKTIWLFLMFTAMWLISYLKVNIHWWEIITLYLIGHGGGFFLGYDLLFKRK